MDDLAACLPSELRSEPITRVSAGLSGAGVYRVGQRHILKISPQFARAQLASDAGIGPRVIHVDAARSAVVMEAVPDPTLLGFMGLYMRDRAGALALLGTTLRRVHDQPAPAGAPAEPRGFLANVETHLTGMPLPAFARDAIASALAAEPPPQGPLVLSHNDVNPSNLAYDGERLVLLDWDTSGPNDALWDLATIAMFLRLDDAASLALIAAHDGTAPSALPPRFVYSRRLSGAMCGTIFLMLARQAGHPGDASAVPNMLPGRPDVASPQGKFAFGLTLLKASL